MSSINWPGLVHLRPVWVSRGFGPTGLNNWILARSSQNRSDRCRPDVRPFDLLSQSVRKVRKAAVRANRSRRSVTPNRSRRGIRAATWRAESERLCLVDAARAISACYNFATNLQAPLFLLHLIAVSVQSIMGATAKTGALKYLLFP